MLSLKTSLRSAAGSLLFGLLFLPGLSAQAQTTITVNPQDCTAQEGVSTIPTATCGFKFSKQLASTPRLVNFSLLPGNTATQGVDYELHAAAPAYAPTGGACVPNANNGTLVTNAVCIPANNSTAFVKVVPIHDTAWEPHEYVGVSVSNWPFPPSTANLRLQDNDTLVKITVDKSTSQAKKAGQIPAYLKFERDGVIGFPYEDLVVHYTISPTVPNNDFTVTPDTEEEAVEGSNGKVTIRSGTWSRSIKITPLASAVVPKVVKVTIVAKPWYTRVSPYANSINIVP